MKRTIISLCIVTSIWEKSKKDYLDNFVPFIATLIFKNKIEYIEECRVIEICDKFYSEFGLNIPFHPMISILNKCKKRGLLKKKHGKFYPVNKYINKLEFTNEVVKFQKEFDLILNDFIRYSKMGYKTDITNTEATDLVLNLLQNNDIEILFSKNNEKMFPDLRLSKKYKKHNFILNKYITSLHEKNQEYFNYLNNISLGHIIASSVLFDEYDWSEDTVKDCDFYIDSPIILRLLGASSSELSNATEGLIKSLLLSGAKLKTFKHIHDEVYEILDNSLNYIDSIYYDPLKASKAIHFFKQEGYKRSDIERFINKIDYILEKYKISIEEKPKYLEEKYQIGDDILKKIIEETFSSYNPYFDKVQYEKRTMRDVDSISAIYRLRKNRNPRYLRQAKFIFLTTNGGLAIANKKYCFEHDKENELLACLTDVFVGTILWMHTPVCFKNDNKKKLIAQCYASIQPDPQLEGLLLNEARKLKDSDQINDNEYMLLNTTYVTKDLLSEKTLGDPAAFTPKIASEIIEEIKKEYQKDLLNKLKKEKAKSESTIEQRDRYLQVSEKMIMDKSRRKTLIQTIIVTLALIIATIFPIFLSLTKNLIFIIITIIDALFLMYLSYIKHFNIKKYYKKKINQNYEKLKSKLLG